MGFGSYSFTKDEKARGRRKGRKKIKAAIQSAVSGGPNELLLVLNAVARRDDYTPEARARLLELIYPRDSWRKLGWPKSLLIGDPRALAPLWFAVKGIQHSADLMIKKEDPLCDRLRYIQNS